jgi:hypothetical protein
MAVSLAGGIWSALRDRSTSGPVALWGLATAFVLTLSPISLIPYRPALDLQPRMYAVLVLPGALLAAVLLVDVVGARWKRAAGVAAACVAALAIACAVRLHQDAVHRRAGVEWAHRELVSRPGASVVTDPRTAALLRMRSPYAPPFSVLSYSPDLPPPEKGTLLLHVPAQSTVSATWDRIGPPPWWTDPSISRRVVAEAVFPSPRRLRGPRADDERTLLIAVD